MASMHADPNQDNILMDVKADIKRLVTASKKELEFGENPIPALLKATTLPR